MMNLPDPKDLRGSVSDGPMSWAEAFGKAAETTDETMRLIENGNADYYALEKAYDQRIAAIRDVTGQELPNPMRVASGVDRDMAAVVAAQAGGGGVMPLIGEMSPDFRQRQEAEFNEKARALSGQYRQEIDQILSTSIGEDKGRVMRDAQAAAAKAGQAPELGTVGRLGAQIWGGLTGATNDPSQWGMAMIGAGTGAAKTVAGRIGQTMFSEALLNGSQELVLQGMSQERKRAAGLEHGMGDMLANAGVAATFGALFGGSVQGAGEFWSALRARAPAGGATAFPDVPDEVGTAAMARVIDGAPERGDVEIVAQAMGVDLGPEKIDMLNRSFEERMLDELTIRDDASPAEIRVYEAAQRYAEDPDNNPPPELLERMLAEQEAGRMRFSADDYERMFSGDQNAVDDIADTFFADTPPDMADVRGEIERRLIDGNVLPEADAPRVAELYDAFYRTIAADADTGVSELLLRYPLPRFAREESGAVSAVGGREYQQFAGVGARTLPAGLDEAIVALADGADAAEVYRQTGWMVGPDGRMRFEISDDQARLRPGAEAIQIRTGNLDTDSAGLSMLDLGTRLSDVLDHPALFDAYPALKDVRFRLEDGLHKRLGAGAMFNPERKIITVDEGYWRGDLKAKVSPLSSLLHEIQHFIQTIEKFDNGSGGVSGGEAYRVSAGEVEARNTQRRVQMTADERRASYPGSTADVAPAEQVSVASPFKVTDADVAAARSRIAERDAREAEASVKRDRASAVAEFVDRNVEAFADIWEQGDADFFLKNAFNDYIDGNERYWQPFVNDFIRERLDADKMSLLFQSGPGVARGSIELRDSGAAVIRLFEHADASTVLHESGHFFLSVLKDMADSGERRAAAEFSAVKGWWKDNAADVAADANRARDAAGVTDADVAAYLDAGTAGSALKDEAIDIGLHEQWARGFEAYLMRGDAPSAGMAKAFERFRQWLTSVYRSLKELNVRLSPQVVDVFDRLFASDADLANRTLAPTIAAEPMDAVSLRMAEEQAGDLVEPPRDRNGNPENYLDFIGVEDGDGNIAIMSAREALALADEPAFHADLLEACKL